MEMEACRRARFEASGAIRGAGLEIGPGTRPTIVDPAIEMHTLDFYSTEELIEQTRRNGGDPAAVMPVDYVARGEDYRGCVDRSFDFIIANHVIEHIIDVVAWLRMLSELLEPNGHLLLTIPDKKYSFDRFRDDTSIAHLLNDYFSDAPLAEKARIHALETHIYYDRAYIGQSASPDRIFDAERMRAEKHHPGVHCHVFQGETFLKRILKPLLYTRLVDFTLADFQEKSPFGEFYVVLRKGWTPFAYSLDDFYECSRAAHEEAERRNAALQQPAPDEPPAPLLERLRGLLKR